VVRRSLRPDYASIFSLFVIENGLIDEVGQQIKSRGGHEKFVYKITERGIA
jgi:hypothetical protein